MAPTVTYSDHEVMVNGLRLHYQEWGDATSPTILMIHGFGVSGHMFDEFADRARDRFRLIAIDQRGHGDSAWSPDGDYTRGAFVSDIEGFRKALDLDDFILMGHSMGGLNSVSYAVAYHEHIQSLVLIDVGPEAAKEGVDNIVRFTRGPDDLEFEEFVQMAHRFNPRRSIENIRERMRHRLRPKEDGKWTWKFDERFRKDTGALKIGGQLSNDETWQLFRSLKMPTLLVRGAESDVLSQEVAERCVRELPRARLVVVPGAGHSVPGDNPDGFTEAVLTFLNDVSRGKFDPFVEAAPPPLAELVTAQDRAAAARKRPGMLTLALAGVGVAAAVGGVTLAKRRRARPERTVPGAVDVVDEMDLLSQDAMARARTALGGRRRRRPVLRTARSVVRAGMLPARFALRGALLAAASARARRP